MYLPERKSSERTERANAEPATWICSAVRPIRFNFKAEADKNWDARLILAAKQTFFRLCKSGNLKYKTNLYIKYPQFLLVFLNLPETFCLYSTGEFTWTSFAAAGKISSTLL